MKNVTLFKAHIIAVFLIMLTALTACNPTPEIKVTEGSPRVISDLIKNAFESTPLVFDIEAPTTSTTDPSTITAPILSQKPLNGTLTCQKVVIKKMEVARCTYLSNKYFFGEDHAQFLTKNIRGKNSLINVLINVANVYSRPVAYDGTFNAPENTSKVSFTLPEAFEPDYPQEKDKGLDYADFQTKGIGELKCARRNCVYDLKTSFTANTVITFTYRAVEKLRGENESLPATIKINFLKIQDTQNLDTTTLPEISDINLSLANFVPEITIPFRALASNEEIEYKTLPTSGDIVLIGTTRRYKLKKLNFTATNESISYQIKKLINGKYIYSETKKINIAIPAPMLPSLATNSQILFDPKIHANYSYGYFSQYPQFDLISKFNYDPNMPYAIKIVPTNASKGTIICTNKSNDKCTYSLPSFPLTDGEDTFNFWIESGDPLVKTIASPKAEMRIKYYSPQALDVDNIVIDPTKHISTYDSINFIHYIRGYDKESNVSLKFTDTTNASKRLTCNGLICTIIPIELTSGSTTVTIDFEVNFNVGQKTLTTKKILSIKFYAPIAPIGNPPSNSINVIIPNTARKVSGVRLLARDEDSTPGQLTFSAFTANGDSGNKVEITNCVRSGFDMLCDVGLKSTYVTLTNDTASFTYKITDETNLSSPVQTLNVSMSPSLPKAATTIFNCIAPLGATECTGTLPAPLNKSELGNYTYKLRTSTDPTASLGTTVITSGTAGTVKITLNPTEAGNKSKKVTFEYDIISQSGLSLAQKGYATFTFKTATTNLAPTLLTNNFNFELNVTSVTKTINFSDPDTDDQDHRIFFNGVGTQNKITITNSNGKTVNITCGGDLGNINPTQCKFELKNPPLTFTSETFTVDFQMRDIFLDGTGNDLGKSSVKNTLMFTFNRDMLPIAANNTNCVFVLNSKEANCDIDGLQLFESNTNDVSINLVNSTTNGTDAINCTKTNINSIFKINCKLILAQDILNYPMTKDFYANFTLINTTNSSLSMKTSKKINFSFSRDPKIYTKSQSFSTSTTAQLPGVDILWVVDNTFTMGKYQDALSANFDSFINTFVPIKNGVRTTPYPFKMTAITTDGYLNSEANLGDLCLFTKCSANNNPLLINDSLAKENFTLFKQNFDSIIKVGTIGNPVEKSIESMQTFFNKNSQWASSNNLLVLIFITDELEQSYSTTNCPLPESKNTLNLAPGSPSVFTQACTDERLQWSINQITKLKSRKDLIKVFSIIDTNEDHGGTYGQLSKNFNGISQSINSSFASLLAQMGTSITDTFLEYNLTFQGTFKQIDSVTIDGIPQEFVFTAPNKVKLKNAPLEGKTLIINYKYTNND